MPRGRQLARERVKKDGWGKLIERVGTFALERQGRAPRRRAEEEQRRHQQKEGIAEMDRADCKEWTRLD
jgi:hypothetical protein